MLTQLDRPRITAARSPRVCRAGVVIARLLGNFVDENDLGIVGGEGGTLQILSDRVRMPDVWFVSWSHFPDRKLPREPVPHLAPDLAIEVLSAGNTPGEMARKLRDYFAAGAKLVWYIDPQTQTATAYTSVDEETAIPPGGTLEAGDVIFGFMLSLAEVFQKAGSREYIGNAADACADGPRG